MKYRKKRKRKERQHEIFGILSIVREIYKSKNEITPQRREKERNKNGKLSIFSARYGNL